MTPNAVLRFVLVYTMPETAVRAAVEEVGRAVAEGVLTLLPVHRFGLECIAAAHDAVQARRRRQGPRRRGLTGRDPRPGVDG